MRRLYLQIYLAFVAVVCVYALLLGAAWHFGPARADEQRALDGLSAAAADLFPARAPREELEAALRRVAGPAGAQLTLWSADGVALAAAGEPLPFPGAAHRAVRPWRADRRGFTATLRLPDGRWLVARHGHRRLGHGLGLLAATALLAASVAIGAYPVARRLTRRLERLRAGVEGLGGGDLHARVPVEGRDEVAALARSFNRAADRIEALVGAQRTLLASASHELRSPLARLRVALELAAADRPELRDRAAADVAELDALIEELLLASRLESAESLDSVEEVDLLGLAAEEASRGGAESSGQPVVVRGDLRLLRRLVRNLIENARTHGAPPVELRVDRTEDGRARLAVCDRGAGVPEAERDRIFTPFYRPSSSRAGTGTGLGLALVRQIARRHGGEVACLGRSGGGACFEVVLPGTAAV